MQRKKYSINNVLLSGYLREHEEYNKTRIPSLISSVIHDYLKQYSLRSIGYQIDANTFNTLQRMITHPLMLELYSNRRLYHDYPYATNDFKFEYFYSNTNSKVFSSSNTFICTSLNALNVGPININNDSNYLNNINNMISSMPFTHKNDKIIDIKCGLKHVLFLSLYGFVFAQGSNDAGQCGLSKRIIQTDDPLIISFKSTENSEDGHNEIKITAIACGELHSLFLDSNGQLFVTGFNYCGQLGISSSDIADIAYETETDDNDTTDTSDATSDAWTDDEFEFGTSKFIVYQPVINTYFNILSTRFCNIYCGAQHSLVITKRGDVYTFGHNGFGNLGNGRTSGYGKGEHIPNQLQLTADTVTEASCGINHNVLVTYNSNIIVFGDNTNNQCSMINNKQQITLPYVLSKQKEFGVPKKSFVEKVICIKDVTILIMDIYKRTDNC